MDLKAMQKQVSNLNDTERTVISEMYINKATDEELAEKLNLSPGLIRKIKLIAMRKLIGFGEHLVKQ